MMNSDIYMNEMRKIILSGKPISMILSGNSMSPFLVNKRDYIYVEPAPPALKKGDMCFFQRLDGRFIMHRVCKVKDSQYWFVGDAQPVVEGPIDRNQIFGLVSKVKRKGKWIQRGDFWWDFFEKIWINIIPFRIYILRLYSIFGIKT